MSSTAARTQTWLQQRPWVADALIAVAVLGYESMYITLIHHQQDLGTWVYLGFADAVAMCAAFPVRRRWPFASCVAVFAASWGQILIGLGLSPGAIAMNALMLFSVTARFTWPWAGLALTAVTSWIIAGGIGLIAAGMLRIGELGLIAMGALLVAVLGSLTRQRRHRLDALSDRAAQLARERDARERIAAAEERARIARELHDLISHSLGTMIVMADGAARTAEGDPRQAAQAMARVRDTGRQAMTEMRRMLDVLRDDDPASRFPQPGLENLDRLLSETRSTGLRVDLRVHGEPVALPAGLDLAAYRIVQEALTNARTHGGPLLSLVTINLVHRERSLELSIIDDGSEPAIDDAKPAWSTGHGLVGMRERVQAYGGQIETGPRPEGGYRVHVIFPIGDQP